MERSLSKLSLGRANAIDFLRFFLAVLVIYSHSYALSPGVGNRLEPISIATGGQKTGGELAVEGFFILSGFLITRSWTSCRSPMEFLKRRALRIYPGFFAAALFSGLIAAPLLASDAGAYWREFSASAFVLGALNLDLKIPEGGVNGSLWSIRYEFFCYLTVAAFGLLGILRRRGLVLAAFALCMACYGCQVYLGWRVPGSRLTWLYCYPDFWPRVMSAFLAGALAYLYRDRISFTPPLVAAAVLALGVGVALPSLRLLALTIPVAGTYMLLLAAFRPVLAPIDFAKRGDLSYGLYLYAFPIQRLLVQRYGTWLGPWGLFLAATAITLVFAFASWHLVEERFLKLKRPGRVEEPRAIHPGLVGPPGGPMPAADIVA